MYKPLAKFCSTLYLASSVGAVACTAAIDVNVTYPANTINLSEENVAALRKALESAKQNATAPAHYTVVYAVVTSETENPVEETRMQITKDRELQIRRALSDLGVPDERMPGSIGSSWKAADSMATAKSVADIIVQYGCKGT